MRPARRAGQTHEPIKEDVHMPFLRPLFAALAAATAAFTSQAQTAVPKPTATAAARAPGKVATAPSSSRIDTCEKRAADRTGDALKAYVEACLKTAGTQQAKMKECNVAAKGKKGDERRAFMSQCLRKKKA
jgi:hypothetical protein